MAATGVNLFEFDELRLGVLSDGVLAVERAEKSRLIAAIVAGDTQLYRQLIRPYQRSVYFMSLSYMKDEKDAEDVAQEAFLRAFRSLRTFRGDSKFSTWLIKIALNEARKRLRRRATVRIVPLEDLQSEKMPVSGALLKDWRDLPSDVVECAEIRRLLWHAVEMLPHYLPAGFSTPRGRRTQCK